jgi:hypothetical protein
MARGRKAGVGVFGILLSATVAVAATADMPQGPALDRGQWAAFFQELKALESESHRERIRILQVAEACIQRAATFREYRQCERAEHDAREQLRARLKTKREALRGRLRAALE